MGALYSAWSIDSAYFLRWICTVQILHNLSGEELDDRLLIIGHALSVRGVDYFDTTRTDCGCVFLLLLFRPPREEAPHTLYGNRAAARLALGRAEGALADAEVSQAKPSQARCWNVRFTIAWSTCYCQTAARQASGWVGWCLRIWLEL